MRQLSSLTYLIFEQTLFARLPFCSILFLADAFSRLLSSVAPRSANTICSFVYHYYTRWRLNCMRLLVFALCMHACSFVYMRVHARACTCMRVHACACVYMCLYAFVGVCMRLHAVCMRFACGLHAVCMHLHAFACVLHAFAPVCTRLHAFACVCMRLHAFTCVCVHLRAFTKV